jgi:hypothetical protein
MAFLRVSPAETDERLRIGPRTGLAAEFKVGIVFPGSPMISFLERHLRRNGRTSGKKQ